MLDYLSDEEGDQNEAAKKQKLHQAAFEEVRADLQKILTSLMRHQYGAPFNQPVDPVALNIPDYFEKITQPMDFGTIQVSIQFHHIYLQHTYILFSMCTKNGT